MTVTALKPLNDAQCALLAADYPRIIGLKPETLAEQRDRILRIREIHQMLSTEFGRRRGWTVSPRSFNLGQLGRRSNTPRRGEEMHCAPHNAIDHAYYYRDGGMPSRPAGIAVHLYDMPFAWASIREVCVNYDLVATEIYDFPSWWNPGSTRLVLYEPKNDQHGYAPPARIVRAPWSDAQVAALTAHQRNGSRHPYTCPGFGCADRNLRATAAGWVCACGSYTQDWAQAF